jgi:hypothetical protein
LIPGDDAQNTQKKNMVSHCRRRMCWDGQSLGGHANGIPVPLRDLSNLLGVERLKVWAVVSNNHPINPNSHVLVVWDVWKG